jgi:hypothetical protein
LGYDAAWFLVVLGIVTIRGTRKLRTCLDAGNKVEEAIINLRKSAEHYVWTSFCLSDLPPTSKLSVTEVTVYSETTFKYVKKYMTSYPRKDGI